MAHVDYATLTERFKPEIAYCRELKVGEKIKFRGEKQRYTIKAKSDNFIICTKPFNLQKTCFYTIIDLTRLVRGANDRIFNPYNYMTQANIDTCLDDLEAGEIEVSHRNCVQLDVEVPENARKRLSVID